MCVDILKTTVHTSTTIYTVKGIQVDSKVEKKQLYVDMQHVAAVRCLHH